MTSTKSKIDYVIEQAGAFGKYQWLQLLCLCMGSFLAAFHFLIIVFHSITPKHRLVAYLQGSVRVFIIIIEQRLRKLYRVHSGFF